jgi:hypothetical protein
MPQPCAQLFKPRTCPVPVHVRPRFSGSGARKGQRGTQADVHGRKHASELLPLHDGPGIMYGEFLFGGTGLFLRLVAGLMASAEIARNDPAAEAALDVSRELVACELLRMARRAHSTSALMTLAVVREGLSAACAQR